MPGFFGPEVHHNWWMSIRSQTYDMGIRGKRTTTNNSSPINFECIKALLPKGWDKIPSRNPWLMISYTKCLTYLFEKRCNGDNFLINLWLRSVLAVLLWWGCFQGLQFLQGVFEAAHLLPHGGHEAVKRPTLGVQAAQGLLKLTAARWHFLLNLHSEKIKTRSSYFFLGICSRQDFYKRMY